MKKVLSIVMLALVLSASVYAQMDRQLIRERKQIARQTTKELNKKAVKLAVKEARSLKKDGWKVTPGQIPLDRQLDKLYKMYYEYEGDGYPRYIFGESKSVSKVYDAAKMQAMNNAKIELAGLIETEMTALTESTVSNRTLSVKDAEFINAIVRTSKSLIVQKLGRTLVILECHRLVDDGSTEVYIRLAYNIRKAFEAADEVLKAQLSCQGKNMDEQIDKMWANL